MSLDLALKEKPPRRDDGPGVLDTRFRSVLSRLNTAGRLLKISQQLSPDYDVAGVMKRSDGDLALLFESVGDHSMPVVGNLLASQSNCETAFGMDRNGIRQVMQRAITHPIAPQLVESGPSQQIVVTGTDVDLERLLPVLRHAPHDGGRFISAGVVIVRDPETGVYNASYHRLQLLGGNKTAIKLDYGRHLRIAHERAQARGVPLPIAVCIGPDIALSYAAAYMGSMMPPEADELAAAGGLRGAPLAMTRAITQPLIVPADAEIVLEGEISPTETVHEGPFGEFLGYYSDAGPSPVVTFTALTHREAPLYVAINGAGRETVMLRKYVLEASALTALRAAVPIVDDVELTAGGLHRFHLVLQVNKQRPQDEGLQRNAILAAFSVLKDVDEVVVVDEDIDIRDPVDVQYAISTRMEASRDLVLVPGARGHEYIRVSDNGVRTKLGIDATVPVSARHRFQRVTFGGVLLDPAQATTDPEAVDLPAAETTSGQDPTPVRKR